MIRRSTVLRSLHDLGLAAWFGGTLMGAVGVNGASRDLSVREERVPLATDAWGRFSPVGALAIGAHLIGAVGLLGVNRERVRHQQGVATVSATKAAVTGVALGATAYSWYLGTRLGEAGSVSAASGTIPSGETPSDVASAQQQLRALQWAIPATTGAALVLSALSGEQQRADAQAAGRVQHVVRRGRRRAEEGRDALRDTGKKAGKRARKASKAAADQLQDVSPW